MGFTYSIKTKKFDKWLFLFCKDKVIASAYRAKVIFL